MQTQVREELGSQLRDFDFTGIFIETLGWNFHQGQTLQFKVDEQNYTLEPAAEKAGFIVYICEPDEAGSIPPYPVRKRIEGQIAKVAYEHIIIYVDQGKTNQTWQWVKRESGKRPAFRELHYHRGQVGMPLIQRIENIFFSLDEEPDLTIPKVVSRVQQALDVEKVTKTFYERFRNELKAFHDFIEGLAAKSDREWYASLMLNRMMFIYFIQKQSFLNADSNYLRNKLGEVKTKAGSGKFQHFYHIFLLKLFHDGLGKPQSERDPELADLLGKVPFLNGGLFEVHDLEKENPDIDIPDEAFERLFNFFDEYQWHLDERPGKDDNEINPDVLGYIFEKYINQKQMGAYYTKEDITGYMTRNTVLPFLFDAASRECPIAFVPQGGIWRLLKEDPDRYIYPAVGHGLSWSYSPHDESVRLEEPRELPDHITAGITDHSSRGEWNEEGSEDLALPTETWRELIARRQRHQEIHSKLSGGEVSTVDELITLNLDVEQFARDVIVQSEGPDLLRAFWKAIGTVSVLDPACGSGAFLFAAMNILEPLYSACLDTMRSFLVDLERSERTLSPDAMDDFRTVLEQAERHPNESYFILKSIVLNNLYGVDIMEEAVEICKLRLFLKLVAQLKNYDEIEPLPDIDFNVRAGNTLVGFTSLDAVRNSITMGPNGQHRALFEQELVVLELIEETAEEASQTFDNFKKQQAELGGALTGNQKAELRTSLDTLRTELDNYLAAEYGVDSDKPASYKKWQESHQPFHWFVEFYRAMKEGGFDVVIGNPPYVATNKVKKTYTVKGLQTNGCPDIYGMMVERSTEICRINGRTSMIVPLSLTFSRDFSKLRTLLYEECGHIWFSSFGRIPAALFSFDTRVRNTIYLTKKGKEESPRYLTTRLHRWFESQRPTLFENLSYSEFSQKPFGGLVPKLGSAKILQELETLLEGSEYRIGKELIAKGKGVPLDFKGTAYNWLTFCIERPPITTPDGTPIQHTSYGSVLFSDKVSRDLSLLLLNGRLAFLWWVAIGDDFHLTRSNFTSAPFGPKQLGSKEKTFVATRLPKLTETMSNNVDFKLNAGKNIGNYNLVKCRHITDEVDKAWLKSLGLENLWEEIELEHVMVVRTSYDDDDE